MLYTVYGIEGDGALVEELGVYTDRDEAERRASRALSREKWEEVEIRRESLPSWYC